MHCVSRRYLLQKKYYDELMPRIRKLNKEEFRKFIISLTEIDTHIDRHYKPGQIIVCPLSSLYISFEAISLLFIVYQNKGWTEVSIVPHPEDNIRESLSLAR